MVMVRRVWVCNKGIVIVIVVVVCGVCTYNVTSPLVENKIKKK